MENLKEYCEKGGDKESFGTQALEQVLILKILYNSHGDFDKYMRKFENDCSHMEESEQPLT